MYEKFMALSHEKKVISIIEPILLCFIKLSSIVFFFPNC